MKAKIFIISKRYRDIYYAKRKETLIINLWHGIVLKKICMDSKEREKRLKKRLLKKQINYKIWNYIIVSHPLFINIFAGATNVDKKKILPLGIPRNDIIFEAKKNLELNNKIRNRILNNYNINNPEAKIIFYAPTFRDSDYGEKQLNTAINSFVESFYNKFNDKNIYLLIRKHINSKEYNSFNNKVIDVTDYPDMQHLLIATDLLITDYSSSVFDFMILNRPVILYIYDYSSYIKERGGLYFDLIKLPFLKCYNNKELLNLIINNMDKEFFYKENYNTYPACENCFNFVYNLKKI